MVQNSYENQKINKIKPSYMQLAKRQKKYLKKQCLKKTDTLKWEFHKLNYFKSLCEGLISLKQLENPENWDFILPCHSQELFEQFFCVVFASQSTLFVRPIMNITKAVSKDLPFSGIKHVQKYSMIDGSPAIEIFLTSSLETLLLSFQLESQRDLVLSTILEKSDGLITPDLQAAIKIWIQGLLPNYDYLMLLNRLGNRSFQDISQYPLFPWIISDYFSDEFIKNEKMQYRELPEPIGVLSGHRKQKAKDLFDSISQDKRRFKEPFHQGVYVSTPGYVMFFYMRAVPSLVVRLQSSAFSPSEKIFKSFESLWSSIHSGINYPTELIPEFYSSREAEILLNKFKITLGSKCV